MAEKYGFQYELVQYKWPRWLHQQTEKQRIIWGYKILFLDVLFPLAVDKFLFVDADQVQKQSNAVVWHDLPSLVSTKHQSGLMRLFLHWKSTAVVIQGGGFYAKWREDHAHYTMDDALLPPLGKERYSWSLNLNNYNTNNIIFKYFVSCGKCWFKSYHIMS